VTDVLALLGLIAAFYLGSRELLALKDMGVRIAVGAFLAMAMVLTGTPHLMDPYGFSRPVSPVLLTLTLAALLGRSKWNLFPPLAMTIAVGTYWISPTLGIIRGLTGQT
jgi:hypothetical protein